MSTMNSNQPPTDKEVEQFNTRPKYSLSEQESNRFARLWREEIQFFPEVPWRNQRHTENAKKFAARIYGLFLEEQKQLNKPKI